MKRTPVSPLMIRAAALVLCAALAVLFGLRLLISFDNKYTTKAALTQDGAVLLPESGAEFLVDGWMLYPDVLLSPADFAAGNVPHGVPTWSGEFPNLTPFHADGSPYGAATYRLRLRGAGTQALYLQEPLCAARVFVDGVALGGTGEVSEANYRPHIRDMVFTFTASKNTELIIQTANYSHYYGGIWFPPAIGSADSITQLISARLLLYALLCFSSLSLALYCFVLWFGKSSPRDRATYYFGLICLSFGVRMCYPLLRFFGVPLVRSLYALEDVAALLGLYCAARIAMLLFLPDGHRRLHAVMRALTGTMCGAVLLIPTCVLPFVPALTGLYGAGISFYKLFLACFLLGVALCGCALGRASAHAALIATVAHATCLFWGVWMIGDFEPARGAWPEEYGALCMVLLFAALMVRRSHEISAENQRLTVHLQDEVAEKTQYLRRLLAERDAMIVEIGHDMKSPLTAISNIAQVLRQGTPMLDASLQQHMQSIEDNCGTLADRLRVMQDLSAVQAAPTQLSPVSLGEFLQLFHRIHQPVIELTGPDFLCALTAIPCMVLANEERLSRAIENLIFNALDFTPPEGSITLSLAHESSHAVIRVTDTGCGIPAEELPKLFARGYTTRADSGGLGLGLDIARTIVLEHGGEITVDSAPDAGSVFTIRLPLL